MRLIDADALILSLQINQEICFGCPEPEWLDELIQILENAPTVSVDRPTDGDLISRADAIDALCHDCAYYTDAQCKTDSGYWCESGVMIREDIPSADKPSRLLVNIQVDTEAIVKRIKEEYEIVDKPKGVYECFHCCTDSVVWDADFDFEDFGYEGEGIVHVCHCANCGAQIEYRIRTDDEQNRKEEEHEED